MSIEGADAFLGEENPAMAHIEELEDELQADVETGLAELGYTDRIQLKASPAMKRAITNIIGDGETFLISLAFDEKKND